MEKVTKLGSRCGFCEQRLAMNEGEMCPRCVDRFAAHVRSWKRRRFFNDLESDIVVGGFLVVAVGILSYCWGAIQ